MTQKISGEKKYHIYARNTCIYHSLKEEEFETTWKELNRLADFLSSDVPLSYEEVIFNKELSLNSSH